MRRIPLILATLLLTLVAGCGSAATEPLPFSQFPIDLPLVAEQEIGFHGGRDTVVTLPGETAHFDWTDGKLYLNGVTIRPLQPFQSEVPSLEALQQIYGGVPRIQELVATGAGSDHDRWYRAYLTWQQEKVDLVRATEQEFAASVVNHSTEVAAQASLNIVVAATNLVERAEVRIADPFSKIATIVLWWKGQPVEAHIEMLPDYHQFEAHLDAFYDREQALRLVRLIHLTTSTGKPCRVELGAGIWIEGYTGGNPQGAK